MAITRSTAFGIPWIHWVLEELPELGFPTFPLPQVPWIHEACQVTKHHVTAKLNQDHQFLLKRVEYNRQLDRTTGSSRQAFAAVRGDTKPLIKQVQQALKTEGHLVSLGAKTAEIYGDSKTLEKLDVAFPVTIEHQPGKLFEVG